jgi:hypothetical protein
MEERTSCLPEMSVACGVVLCFVRVLHAVLLLLLCWSSTSCVVFTETETRDVLKAAHTQDADTVVRPDSPASLLA